MVAVSYFVHYNTLLQNATDAIPKCDRYFIRKYVKSLLQNASGFLLQNATGLLQNVAVFSKCHDFIRKCDSYYKISRYNVDCGKDFNRPM